ncbi:TPA: hypothetical protein N0F65_009564, partial [Lagenidium giganteum]
FPAPLHHTIDLYHRIQKTAKQAEQNDRVALLLDFSKAYDTLDRHFMEEAIADGATLELLSSRRCAPRQHASSIPGQRLSKLSARGDARHSARVPIDPLRFILALNPLYLQLNDDQPYKASQWPTHPRYPASPQVDLLMIPRFISLIGAAFRLPSQCCGRSGSVQDWWST